LAGVRADAQSRLGPPVPAQATVEPAAGATLGAPTTGFLRAGDPPADAHSSPEPLPALLLPEADLPLQSAPTAESGPVPDKKTANAFRRLAGGNPNDWSVGLIGPSPLFNGVNKDAVQRVGTALQEPVQGEGRKSDMPAGAIYDQGRPPFPPMIRLDVPGSQALFRLESEDELRARMRQEARQREQGKPLYFPETRIVMTAEKAPPPRLWHPLAEMVEPADVGFRRLWFHQINFDRYGWDLGIFQPAVSTGAFFFDILTLPIQFAIEPCRRFDYNTGWDLPGDPAPLALYPPRPK